MSTFLGIAPKQITINHVEDVNTPSTLVDCYKRQAVDVYYVVSTTTPQVASAVVDETNRALNTTGSGALLSSLQSAGLVISQVVIIRDRTSRWSPCRRRRARGLQARRRRRRSI